MWDMNADLYALVVDIISLLSFNTYTVRDSVKFVNREIY